MGLTTYGGNNGYGGIGSAGGGGGCLTPPASAGPDDDSAESYLINYNAQFAAASPTLYRDTLLGQICSVLIGKTKPNVLLVGSAGVGKTRLVEELARRIVSADPALPSQLTGSVIYELPLANILADASFVGQLEARVQTILAFLEDPNNHAIVFIDEIHQLMNGSRQYASIAQILKPAMARGSIRCIGATTTQEVKDLNDDPAFSRRFSRVIVDELTMEQTVGVLDAMRPSLLMHYGGQIMLTDDILPVAARLAEEYRPAGSHRPDNAITLLDRAMADAIIVRKKMEADAIAAGNTALAGAMKTAGPVPLSETQLKNTAFHLMTGNAIRPDYNMDTLKQALARIHGQDAALDDILHVLRRISLGLHDDKRPAAFLFAGPSGVGKTEVTKILAEKITGTKPISLNMTEYHSAASINRIIGSPAGYVGSDSHAELPFDTLESNPYQFILLDEFEKADPSVQRLFMSALEEGEIQTNRGTTIDFSRAIIVATTNQGHTGGTGQIGFGPANRKKQDVSALSAGFDLALLNRFTKIITFEPIAKETYKDILAETYQARKTALLAKRPRLPLPDTIPDDELNALTEESFVPEFGARPAGRAIEEYIERTLL